MLIDYRFEMVTNIEEEHSYKNKCHSSVYVPVNNLFTCFYCKDVYVRCLIGLCAMFNSYLSSPKPMFPKTRVVGE